MLVEIISKALGPIILGGGVGLLSGYSGFIKREYSQAFADFVVKIALPIALFVAAANANPSTILDLDYALAIGSGLVLAFIGSFIAGRVLFKHDRANASMQALCASFPDMAYCGPPILLATIGASGLIAMVIGNLIYTVIILPIALMLIGGNQQGQSVGTKLWNSLRQPLVFLPILGAILSVSGVKLPELVTSSLNELGETAGGVALFFLGLYLSGIKPNINWEVLFSVFVKNIVQGAIILGVGLGLGLQGDLLKSAFIIGILPTATANPALAVALNIYEEEAASTVMVSTVLSLITMAIGIAVVEML
jgi:malonate transporter